MYCAKCGCAHSDNAKFCARCGNLIAAQSTVETVIAVQPTTAAATAIPVMTQKEYFANSCSATAKKKRIAIKVLSIACLAIQAVLEILFILTLIVAARAIQQVFGASAAALSGVVGAIISSLIFLAGTFAFTIGGMKKNSTGFWVAATIFSFASTTIGSNVLESPLRSPIALGIVAIYRVLTVLNCQNTKEYITY